ncbi:uncharacterized protein RJT21DRAFT_5106 [Scheffersomyces amazonensis]|uniref:uncharacterized protein n=1 Tax=Scheffersomyces amazonensis TaxID=1078765 RepID=UPI00315D5C13
MVTWLEEVSRALDERDEFEKADSKYHSAFMQLNEQLQLERSFRNQQLQENNNRSKDNNNENSKISGTDGNGFNSGNETNDKYNSLEAQTILKEDIRLRQENQELIDSLNRVTVKSERLETLLKDYNSEIKKYERKINRLKRDIEALNLQMEEKNKLILMSNEEVLSKNLELNMNKQTIFALRKDILSLKRDIADQESNNYFIKKKLDLVNEQLSNRSQT